MKTEYRLAEILKTMMSEVPLDSISVTTLTKRCHVNRQTFYYHFHDIYDLLTLVFLNEQIPSLKETNNIKELVKNVYSYYVDNRGFVDAAINSAGKELFQEFIYNACYQTILRFVNNTIDAKKLHINDRKAITRFYALAYANSIVYYLSTYKNKTVDGLLNCFAFESENSLNQAVERLLILRGFKDAWFWLSNKN